MRRLVPGAASLPDIELTRDGLGRPEVSMGPLRMPRNMVFHSPDGFEWGYPGSGPSDLALNILALFVPPTEAYRLYQKYKWDVIAKLPKEGGVIRAVDVRDWILDQWYREQGPK